MISTKIPILEDPLAMLEDLAVSPMIDDDRLATAIECQMQRKLMEIYSNGSGEDISRAQIARREIVEAARIRSEICQILNDERNHHGSTRTI